MAEQELVNVLDDFKQAILKKDLTGSKTKKINFFSATQMLSLETKHSAFFAWLLDPENEHCLTNAVLIKLLKEIYKYKPKPDKYTAKPRTNIDILVDDRNNTEVSIVSEQQLTSLANSSKIYVYTEKKTDNDKRIDILIDIVDTETVIVIENKIDSTTHDDQLKEYEKYINSKYSTYKKKIFVYLTKLGELPYDSNSQGKRGAYNNEWCAIDYGKICDIIEEVIYELNNNAKQKFYQIESQEQDTLIKILEHYIDMVNTNILNTSLIAREKCKELLSDPKIKEAYEILKAYERIPTPEQIADYVCEQLGGEREGTKSHFWFYTKPMRDYFEVKHSEEYKLAKLRIVCIEQDGKIVIYLNSEKVKGKFSPAQEVLLKSCIGSDYGTKTSPSLIQSIILVEKNLRGMEFDDLKPLIKAPLDEFRKKLDDFIKKYL